MSENKRPKNNPKKKPDKITGSPKKKKPSAPKKTSKVSKKTDSQERGKYYLIGIVVAIIIILFGSLYVSDIIQKNRQDKNEWNNFPFYYVESIPGWMVQVELRGAPYNIPFHYHPRELQDIGIQPGV